jgi:Flp pilus assembly protein TadG
MRKRTNRRGSVALELLILAPVLLGLIFAVVQISTMTAANEHLAAASREGARVAALGGGPDEIRRAVWNHLGQGNLSTAVVTAVITQKQDGTPIMTVLTDSNGQPVDQTDDGNDQNQGFPIPSGEPVLVRVETPAANATPNLMAMLGVNLQNSTLVGQTIMRKE